MYLADERHPLGRITASILILILDAAHKDEL